MRHGRPQPLDARWISGRELGELTRRYDAGGLDRTLAPPDNLLTRARDCRCVLASDLPRSLESATWLASEETVLVEPDLREARLPDTMPIPLRLPAMAHVVVARALWWLNWCQSEETIAATRQRADAVVNRLCELARRHERVMVVGHGMLNRLVAARLRARVARSDGAAVGILVRCSLHLHRTSLRPAGLKACATHAITNHQITQAPKPDAVG